MSPNIIGQRLKALRDTRGLDQEAVRAILGVGSRQIISQIETGERRVSGEELTRLVDGLGVDLDYFTDPLRLVGKEGAFSWRQSNGARDALAAYQERAGRWLAAYRYLASVAEAAPLRQSLRLERTASYAEAATAGERLSVMLELGDVPATRLAAAMEERFGILVLAVDAPPGISGAACRLPELDAVLINRREAPGRRHFDLAHELFHLLTWDTMPPEPIEDVDAKGPVERLANSFASALLMPRRLIEGGWRAAGSVQGLATMLNERADALQVTALALKWRLVGAKLLPRARADAVPDELLRHNGRPGPSEGWQPTLFSPRFARAIADGLYQGMITRRRAAKLLGLDPDGDDLIDLLAHHGAPDPYRV